MSFLRVVLTRCTGWNLCSTELSARRDENGHPPVGVPCSVGVVRGGLEPPTFRFQFDRRLPSERLDPELVEYVCERFKPLDELLRQPWAFGPKITAPGGR
jgi:hypothetical protein